jgi:hypothetical protein
MIRKHPTLYKAPGPQRQPHTRKAQRLARWLSFLRRQAAVFRRETRAVVAIEAAIIMAAMVPAMIAGLGLAQKIYLANGTQFAAFASAAAASRAMAGGGNPTTVANAVFMANRSAVFLNDVTATINVTINGVPPSQTVTIVVTASEPLFIPFGSLSSVSSTVSATD